MAVDSDETGPQAYPLFLDEPTDVDLLSFDAVASTVVEALLDPRLDPVALGLSGSWGSGKTSVLRIIGAQLRDGDENVLVIETDPWRYDPQLGVKESLIGEILSALEKALPEEGFGEQSRSVIRRLMRRVDWTKALRLAATSAVTVTVPSLQGVLDLIKPPEQEDEPEPITDMVQFRAEFESLLASDALAELGNVVVLVDDLDRCLPDTVVEVLETIRLFLSVPKMSFVLAADEERVAEAIATRFPGNQDADEESPARLYLHKIVQTSVPVPALSDFDAEAYLVLLQIRTLVGADEYAEIIRDVSTARRSGEWFDQVASLQRDAFLEHRNVAIRIRPIVHEKTKGNPRRIKRFLNDLSVRLSIANKRGITLDAATIAKLMVLEQYFPADFQEVTGWLREQTLRSNITALETQAGTPSHAVHDGPAVNDEVPDDAISASGVTADDASDDVPDRDADGDADTHGETSTAPSSDAVSAKQFSGGLVRWARLSPSLGGKDIAPYLVLAASFTNVFLSSEGLPESIRDVATQLLSRSPAEARRVSDEVLAALSTQETTQLIAHIAGVIVDETGLQSGGVGSMLRIARLRADAVPAVITGVKRIKPGDLKPGGLTQLRRDDPPALVAELEAMARASGKQELVNAVELAKSGF